jgi:hypothetical protein
MTSARHRSKYVRPTAADIGFWKVAKIFHFLATFQVHPWTVLTFYEPMLQLIEWLGKLVHEPLCGT